MQRITGKQCKTARGLLKWNLSDLTNHIRRNLPARRIEGFERGGIILLEWENQELLKTFKLAGLIFRADMEVAFKSDEMELVESESTFQGEGSRIVIGSGGAVLEDTSKTPLGTQQAEDEWEEEKKKKQKEKEKDSKK